MNTSRLIHAPLLYPWTITIELEYCFYLDKKFYTSAIFCEGVLLYYSKRNISATVNSQWPLLLRIVIDTVTNSIFRITDWYLET